MLGVLHVLGGRSEGGLAGYALGDPLRAALTGWLAVPLLLLLAVFGLLVVTATPVHRCPAPSRLASRTGPCTARPGSRRPPLAPLQRRRPRRVGLAPQPEPEDAFPGLLEYDVEPERSRANSL